MQSFHSGTDTTDLLENAPKLPMFLSLVVNYACAPFAEVAVSYEVESTERWTIKKWFKGKFKDENKTVTGNIVIPCAVFYSGDPYLIEQVDVVRKRVKEVVQTTTYDWRKSYEPKGQQSIGFKQKDKDSMIGTQAYIAMMGQFSDLLLLGTDSKGVTAFKALSEVDDCVDPTNYTTYKKAFKEYFEMYWFDKHFSKTSHTRVQILNSIAEYCEIQSQIWLARQIKELTNELKEEVSILRTV